MFTLTGKRVLFIAPRFFGYEQIIQDELVQLGATVDWLPDRPFDSPVMAAVTKICPTCLFPAVDRLYEQILNEFGVKHYEFIFVVNGQTLSGLMLKRLRSTFPRAQLVLYMWDAVANRSHVRSNLKFFDRIYSFDPEDSKRYQFRLRPLFYGHGFNTNDSRKSPTLYQISFIGTAHTDRFAVVERLRSGLPDGIAAFWYLYLQAPWVLHYHRLTKSNMSHACINDFHFAPLEKKMVEEVFATSHSILDIEHPHQTGLTMRTFETLGANKKLVTTNSRVREYEFFNEDNICIIDRKSPLIAKNFFDTPFVKLPENIRFRYSITGWLTEILN